MPFTVHSLSQESKTCKSISHILSIYLSNLDPYLAIIKKKDWSQELLFKKIKNKSETCSWCGGEKFHSFLGLKRDDIVMEFIGANVSKDID